MSGSPNSSMMLRSHCRSTPELPSYHYVTSYHPIWISILVLIASHYFIYYQYTAKIDGQSARLESLETKLTSLQQLNTQTNSNTQWLESAKSLIRREIDLYDADKTNLTDYALESSGATIVTTRCTKSFLERNIKYSIDGLLPLFFTSFSPRIVIQPSMIPGECWSFAGAEGVMVVQLSRTIIPNAFTYEHIRKELTPDLSIDSAPKLFRVKSLRDANDKEGLLLGEYEYAKDGEPLQQFKIQNPNPIPTRFIELLILSNHGEMQYTCLYRFRVHGNLIQ